MKHPDWTRLFTKPCKAWTQLLFWIIVFCLYILLKEYPSRMTGLTLFCLVLQETLELAIPSYTQNLLILPLFKKRKWIPAIILYLLQIAALSYGLPYFLNAIGQLFPITDRVDWRHEHITFSITAFTIIATAVKIGIDQLIRDRQQKETELRHLKAQLNPHFLFNTLNNLYGLSVTQSPELPNLMLQLSELLRYSLYDTNQNYVQLQKELDYLNNYIHLEKIRLDGKTDIRYTVNGDTTEQYIAPLLLIIYIENAFKHFSSPRNQPAFVYIHIDITGSHMHLNVKNSIDPEYIPVKKKSSGGLGLNNVRQRLDLIYPQQYRLETKKQNDLFEINLQIDLS